MMIFAEFFGKENKLNAHPQTVQSKYIYCNPTDHLVTCDFYNKVRMYCSRGLKCVTVQTHFSTRQMEQNVVNLGHFYKLSCVTKCVAQFDTTQTKLS